MIRIHRLLFPVCLLLLAAALPLLAQSLQTPLTTANLDTVAQWVDGVATPLAVNPTLSVYTQTTETGWNGIYFGANTAPGVRHLRIGLKAAVAVGTVLTQGGGKLSVLKSTATYPGDLGDDTQWIPAQRIVNGKVSTDEVADSALGTWVLPAGTSTRAFRFTRTVLPTETVFIGWLGGMYLMSERMVNIGPQAITVTKNNDNKSSLIVNDNTDTWGAWDNYIAATAQVISPTNPEPITLIWPKDVTLSGLSAVWCGFGAATVQKYIGPATTHPRLATEADWQTIKDFPGLENKYPAPLEVNMLDFGTPVTTRAIRILATAPTIPRHPHLTSSTNNGMRVWLGEMMAFQPLGTAEPATAIIPPVDLSAIHPPIPYKFHLNKDSYVTLVIDDKDGKRVRNLVSATLFPAGDNTAWWDGMDDLGRDTGAASHGLYSVPGTFVNPGAFRVNGLYRQAIDLRYEFPIYNSGNPAWQTADTTGSWMSNHTPPSCSLFVPANGSAGSKPLVYLGSYVSEGTHGLIWVDLNGKKVGGVNWVGGNWTGAQFLARDAGTTNAEAGNPIYIGSAFDGDLRLTSRKNNSDRAILPYTFATKDLAVLSGMAVRDGVIVASLPKLQQLLFVDVKTGAILGTTTMNDPRGLAFDAAGQLLILDGTRLLRVTMPTDFAQPFPTPVVLNSTDLLDPQNMALDSNGNIYVTDRSASHQVKAFTAAGVFIRAIGNPGVPKAGPYDKLHMNNPNGITIDSNNHIWVAETDYLPKRTSVWTLDGQFVNAFYGPSEYGGGGVIDPVDKTHIYYGGMDFKIDWTNGTNILESVIFRPQPGEVDRPDGYGCGGYPQTAYYLNGQRYFTNCFNNNPTNGTPIAMLWKDKNGIAVPVAAMGSANNWIILKGDTFKPKWPAGINLNGDYWQNQAMFVWSDTNDDGLVQPAEVVFQKKSTGGVTIMKDLSFVISRVDGSTMQYSPLAISNSGIPSYDLAAGKELAKDVQGPASSGGDEAMVHPNGWAVMTLGAKPYSQYSLSGVYKGKPTWSYPSMWPGLHASHEAPTPEMPGELIGTTRLLGGFITPKGGNAGPIWTINGNMGNSYMFTADGLFVATLLQDSRQGRSWAMPQGIRNLLMNDVTPGDEDFWPSVTQTSDGKVYMQNRSNLIRIDGLDTIRRFAARPLLVTVDDLTKAQAYVLEREAARQQYNGAPLIQVALRPTPVTVDGLLTDWAGADWASIDKRGVAANFNSNSIPYDVKGAVAINGDKLYAAFSTGDVNLLTNTGVMPNALFKTGGALDLMIGTNPAADSTRTNPVAGDIRVIITKVNNATTATIYRAVVPGTVTPVPFSSPWRTITIDQVVDISNQVQLAGAAGDYEISIPLTVLGLTAADGVNIKGDIGILRGDGMTTVQRVYWSNKATSITSDVPSEAMLTPLLWGTWRFANTP